MATACSHFFAYLARMRFIRRWGLMRNTTEENIQEHSLQTALIAHALAMVARRVFGRRIDPERTMALAAYHEVGEVLTGDLPSPIKHHNPALRAAYG
ncbi:MAG: 5'-deoxynucleotidase, partial [Gemmatimonadota bacterium]